MWYVIIGHMVVLNIQFMQVHHEIYYSNAFTAVIQLYSLS